MESQSNGYVLAAKEKSRDRMGNIVWKRKVRYIGHSVRGKRCDVLRIIIKGKMAGKKYTRRELVAPISAEMAGYLQGFLCYYSHTGAGPLIRRNVPCVVSYTCIV